jgi:uncharacterized protein (DUF2249 family)
MKSINAGTRIASLIRSHPGALDRLISISPRFHKLKNPVMRKLLAGRATIAMAARIAGISVNEFFDQLSPLGFVPETRMETEQPEHSAFFRQLKADEIVELDVRPYLDNNQDPLPVILEAIRDLDPARVLCIINSFEPLPLIALLEKRGCVSYTEQKERDRFHTFFKKKKDMDTGVKPAMAESADWDEVLSRYQDKLIAIDVRELEMPGPMLRILDHLEKLKPGEALFVYHKRVPVFLLPELSARKFSHRQKKIREGEVHLLIFRE